MSIIIQNRRRKIDNIEKDFANATIIDVTSKAEEPWVKFSPFYPHGKIPVPFFLHWQSQTVEGIWQGLKVFESEEIDRGKMAITNMKNIKRTVRKHGKCKGHQAGDELLSYIDARKLISVDGKVFLKSDRHNYGNILDKNIDIYINKTY